MQNVSASSSPILSSEHLAEIREHITLLKSHIMYIAPFVRHALILVLSYYVPAEFISHNLN